MKKLVASLIVFNICTLSSFSQQNDTIISCKEADIFAANFQFQQALHAYKNCFINDTDHITYLRKAAHCYHSLGDLKSAEHLYSRIIVKDSLDIPAMNKIANIHHKNSAYLKAIEQYQDLLRIDSTNSYYHKQLGIVYRKKNSLIPAMFSFIKCLEYNPRDVEAMYSLAELYFDWKEYALADSITDLGLSTDSGNIKLLKFKGRIAYAKKAYQTVIDIYRKLLQHTGDTTLLVAKLYGVSSFHLNNYEESISMLNKVLKMSSDNEVIHYYLALAYKEMGNVEESIQHLQMAVDEGTSENLFTYYTGLGVNYEEEGDYKNAIKSYQQAYKYSGKKLLLYHLARNYDAYYKDKKTALHYYERYLSTNDTINQEYHNYTEHRITELKKIIHFDVDTL